MYFCFTSLLTIGFGDFVPGNSYVYNVSGAVSEREAAAKLVLACCYLLLGLAILCMCFNLIQEKISTQVALTLKVKVLSFCIRPSQQVLSDMNEICLLHCYHIY